MFRTPKPAAPALTVALAIAHLAPSVWADLPDDRDHSLACRPPIACTAAFVPPGTFEVESGALFRRLSGETRQWTFPLLLKQTVAEAVQLQVGSNGYTIERDAVSAQYLDDVTIGAKLHLFDQTARRPSVSISAAASIPTFPSQGYLRTYDGLLTGYVTNDFGPIHADLNVGLNLWRIEDPLPQEWAALALSMNLSAPFGVMAESYVFSDASPVASRDGGFLFAFSETPRTWLVFDQGGDVGFFPATRAYSVFIGMTVIPAVLWRPKTGR